MNTPVQTDPDLELLDTDEVAVVLRCDREWVQRACKNGTLPAVKIGKEWRVTRRALTEFVNQTGVVGAVRERKKPLTARQKKRAT